MKDLNSSNPSITSGQSEDTDDLVLNLLQIIEEQYANIKELTDFEPGLRFAIHRLLDLKQLQLHYLHNPWYTKHPAFEASAAD